MAVINPVLSKIRLSQLNGSALRARWGERVDFNGLGKDRINAAARSTAKIIENGGTAVLFSHNGRPKDVPREEWPTLSLSSAAEIFTQALKDLGLSINGGETIPFARDIIGTEVQAAADALTPRSPVMLTENSRFHKRETAKDQPLVMELARQIVSDTGITSFAINGFSAMHRPHATVTGIAQVVRENNGIVALGIEAEEEITFIWENLVTNPKRPYIGLLGGAKVSGKDGKLRLMENLAPGMDAVVIGGAMLYPFLALEHGEYAGRDPLAAIRRPGELDADIAGARAIRDAFSNKLILPTILFDPAKGVVDITKRQTTDFVMRGIEEQALTRQLEGLENRLGRIGSAIMNGPFSYTPDVTEGTFAAMGFINRLTQQGALTVSGGGDIKKAVKQAKKAGIEVAIKFEPTGGGAMLDLLANQTLPGIEALSDAK